MIPSRGRDSELSARCFPAKPNNVSLQQAVLCWPGLFHGRRTLATPALQPAPTGKRIEDSNLPNDGRRLMDINQAILYAQLVNAAYAILPCNIMNVAGQIVTVGTTNYQVVTSIFANDIATDMNRPAANPASRLV
jgi:hypothetical protein